MRLGFIAGFAAAVLIGGVNRSLAQYSPPLGPTSPHSKKTPSRNDRGIPLGAWLFYPGLFAGTVYNNNVDQTETGRISSWGLRLVPRFTAELDNGIHSSTAYGLMDFQHYSSSADEQNQLDAKVGITHSYEAQRDVTLRFSGDFTRQTDVFGGSAFVAPDSALATTSGQTSYAVSPQITPERYNQFSSSVSAQKNFSRAFVSGGFSIQHIVFDSDPIAGNRDGTIYSLNQRTGFYVTPQIYAFVDPTLDWRRYDNAARDSDGYRVTAGVGTQNQGLWQGEVFTGYQAEKNDTVGTYDSFVLGLRVLYSPTRMLTLRATVDQSLGASSISGTSGTASRVTSAVLNVGYNGLPQGWTANGRAGYVHTDIVNSSRNDDAWLIGANLSYSVWRNFSATLDYQFKTVDSNVAGQSFDQHMVSLGASYRY